MGQIEKYLVFGSLDGLDTAQKKEGTHRKSLGSSWPKEGINMVQGQSPRWPLGENGKIKVS